MPSHLALLRGINVGGRNRVAMDDLRELVSGLGHSDVSTYIQSGNVLFSADGAGRAEGAEGAAGAAGAAGAKGAERANGTVGAKGAERANGDAGGKRAAGADTGALAAEISAALADRLAVSASVIVLTRAELAEVIAANPFPAELDPKRVHALIHQRPLAAQSEAAIAAAAELAAANGARDEAVPAGRTIYLHTPDGFGRSDLAARLTRPSGPGAGGTARNWTTVTKLMELLGA